MTVEVLGTVLGTAIQGQIVGMANAPCLPGPFDVMADIGNSTGLNDSEPVISLEHTVNSKCSSNFTSQLMREEAEAGFVRDELANSCFSLVWLQKIAYMIASGVICLIYVICAIVLFFGVREKKGKTPSSK